MVSILAGNDFLDRTAGKSTNGSELIVPKDLTGLFHMKEHLTSGVIVKHGGFGRGNIVKHTFEFFFGSVKQDPIHPVFHVVFRRIR